MNKPNATKYFKIATKVVKKRSPEILTGLGIAGMVTTVVLSVKATPKALELLEEEKKSRLVDGNDTTENHSLKPVEVVKVAWKPYLPAALTGLASIGCLIGAQSVNARRQAALYSAYKLSETAFAEYKDKVVETIGEKKEKKVRDEVAKDKVENNPASKTEIFMTGKGESLFYEPISDRYFMSDIETIRKVINDLNFNMGYGSAPYVSLSELYDELGINRTKISDDIGWTIKDGLIEADFSTQMSDDGRPCIVLDFIKNPTYDFDELF